MIILLLFVCSIHSLKIGNSSIEAWYNSYGKTPTNSFTAEAIISPELSFDSCVAFRESQNKDIVATVTGKVPIFSFTRERNQDEQYYCAKNLLVRNLQRLGAVAVIFLYKIEEKELYTELESSNASAHVKISPFVRDTKVEIPSVVLSRRESILFLQEFEKTNIVTFEAITDTNKSAINLRIGFYIALRVYSSVAFSCLVVVSSYIFYKNMKRKLKRKGVTIAPLILVGEVIVISLFRALHNMIDPFGYLGILSYFVSSCMYEYTTLLIVSTFILLVLFWINAVTANYVTNRNFKILPRIFLYIFIAINIALFVTEIVMLYEYSLIVYNALIGGIVLTVDISYICVCIKFMITLKMAKDIKSELLKKISRFVLTVTIISFITLVAVGVSAAFEDYVIPFHLLYRILETILLSTILVLVWDKRVSKEQIGESSRTTFSNSRIATPMKSSDFELQ